MSTKKVITIVAVAIVLFIMALIPMAVASAEGTFYPIAGRVVEIDISEDLVIFVDGAGNIWSFYGIEDLDVGDVIACIMFDNGTETITDDEVIDVEYAGIF